MVFTQIATMMYDECWMLQAVGESLISSTEWPPQETLKF